MQPVQGSCLQPQEKFQYRAKIEGKSQTPLKAILATLVSYTKDFSRISLSQQERKFLWPPYYTAVSRGWSIKKNIAAMKHTGKRLTLLRSSRGLYLTSSQTKVSIPSFLPCLFPSSQTGRYRVSLFSQTHILLASVFPTNLSYNKKERKKARQQSFLCPLFFIIEEEITQC